jgi:uncharacterized membrane protein YfcA
MTSPIALLGLTSDLLLWQLLLLTLISLLVGLLGGFLGLALGTMRLPALLLMGVAPPIAAGTNILVSTLGALAGSAGHLREGRVVLRVVVVMGVPSVAGAFVGGFFGSRVPVSLLLAVAGAFVLWQGVELHLRSRRQRAAASAPIRNQPTEARPAMTPRRFTIESAIGLGIGLLGGAVGLILGSMRLPVLINTLRMDPRLAAGTNLVIGLLLGVSGFVGHGLQREVDLLLLLTMGTAAVLGSAYGARLTGRVNIDTLVRVMALVLLIVGGLLLWRAVPLGS